ncbi:MAG: lamin tail domain-containing protein [Bacteroidia bacterium]|jgi:hypothetical protein
MKQTLLSILVALGTFHLAQAQCNELFISEYVEGDFFNKGLELYNPTPNPIDLAQYRIIRWDNGSTDADQPGGDGILNLTGTIGAYSTHVIVINTTLQGQETPPDSALAAKADAFYGTSCVPGTGVVRTLCFNGDDALSLQKANGNSWLNIDIFACIGERPSNSQGTFSPTAAWTDIAPYSSMPAGYDGSVPYFFRYWTQDQTMKRKPGIQTGVKINPDPETFNPSVEWDTIGFNMFDSLGFHSCDCQILGIQTAEDGRELRVFPSPAASEVRIDSDEMIERVEIYNLSGALLRTISFAGAQSNVVLNIQDLEAGIYLIHADFVSNSRAIRKLSVVK